MSERISFDSQLMSMTTIIETTTIKGNQSYSQQASAFYYTERSPVEPENDGLQWWEVNRYWLVTNRHVALPQIDGIECVPYEFKFYLRKMDNQNINWSPIVLSQEELLSNLKLHRNKEIDVALVDVTAYIIRATSNEDSTQVILPRYLSDSVLPENQPISIEVASDIIVASYPLGFYDDVNKFPIVKSGIVASAWGCYFKGVPIFQIDAQLFPGSSGGLVISKPIDIAMIDGKLKINNTKQFVLLGIYSGEYTWNKEIELEGKKGLLNSSFGLGNVWYSYLIPQIITNGVGYSREENQEEAPNCKSNLHSNECKILKMLQRFCRGKK